MHILKEISPCGSHGYSGVRINDGIDGEKMLSVLLLVFVKVNVLIAAGEQDCQNLVSG